MRGVVLVGVLAAWSCSSGDRQKHSGFVTLTSWEVVSSPSQAGEASARFFATEFPSVVSTTAPCELDHYASSIIPDDGFDAGLITVSGTHQAITLSPDTLGHYPQFADQMQTLFNGGEALTIAARGGEVPAFTEQLVAPAKIVVSSPPPPTAAIDLMIPIDQDFVLGWTGGSGTVQVRIDNTSTGEMAMCRFPASDGSGVIPHAVLAHLGRGAGVQVSIDSVDYVHVYLGDWRVDVSAVFNGMFSNDQIAFTYAELL